MPTLHEQCDPRHPLRKLGDGMPWGDFEEAFGEYYSEEGRPAKPVRLMVGLLLLKQMYDQSDEDVVERWVENPYWQQFCGMSDFQWELPCDPSDLVYFRQRIGEQGVALILAVSAQMHGQRAQENEVVVDSTVQEKNVTYPVDTKQYRKIIMRCWKLADKSGVRLRRRYRKEVRACLMAQRLRNHYNELTILCGDATKSSALLKSIQVDSVSSVVSSLPLLNIPLMPRYRILKSIFEIVQPGGNVIQFTYSPFPPIHRRICSSLNIIGQRKDFIIKNIPPAFVWEYKRKETE